jgi:hypothetical protein
VAGQGTPATALLGKLGIAQEIELAPADLVRAAAAVVADIAAPGRS